MLSLFQSNSNDSLNDIIRYEDIELNEVLNIMIEISCYELYDFYLIENQVVVTNQLIKMLGVKNKLLDIILSRIFGLNTKTGAAFHTLTPEDFMKKFNEDKIVRKIIVFFYFFNYSF
jgi:hypothetical protein